MYDQWFNDNVHEEDIYECIRTNVKMLYIYAYECTDIIELNVDK